MPLTQKSNCFIVYEKKVSLLLISGFTLKQISEKTGVKRRTLNDIIRLLKEKHSAFTLPELAAQIVKQQMLNE